MYGLPIKKVQFHTEHNHDLVLSMDAQVGRKISVPVPTVMRIGTDTPVPVPYLPD